jgi:hypothetical protein
VTLYDASVNNRQAAEVMELDEYGLVPRVLAHYANMNRKKLLKNLLRLG